MHKVIKDNQDQIIGWTNTSLPRGTFTEFIDSANYTHRGWIRETLKSLSLSEREEIKQEGQLY